MKGMRSIRLGLAAAVLAVVSLVVPGVALGAVASSSSWTVPFTIGHSDGDESANLDFAPELASASDGRGDIVVAWTNTHRKGTQSVELAIRRVGGGLSRARTITTQPGRVSEPVVAMDAHGDALVVFTRYTDSLTHRQVLAVPVTIGGRVGRVQQISPTGVLAEQPAVAVARDGAATVIYQQDAAAARSNGLPTVGVPDVVAAARRTSLSTGFGPPIPISTVDRRSSSDIAGEMRPRVTVAADGLTTVVWSESTGTGAGTAGTLEVATASAGGGLAAPMSVSGDVIDGGGTTTVPALVGDGAGDALLTFVDPSGGTLLAAGRPGASGAFGAPATLDTDFRDFEGGVASAIGPGGEGLVLWAYASEDQTGRLSTASWQPAGAVTVGSAIAQHRPVDATHIPPVPEAPSVVFAHGRPIVAWQELAYAGSGRDGDCCSGTVSLEFATGATPSSIGAGRLLLPTALQSTNAGTLPAATLVGGGNGRVYEAFMLTNGTVRATRLIPPH